MKKNLILAVLSAVMMLTPSCQKTASNNIKEHGYLAFGDFSLDLDEEVITKGAPADGGYTIFIYKRVAGELGDLVKTMKYSEVIASDDKISLVAGDYTLVARSQESEVPAAAWEEPYYGASYDFSIAAGLVTTVNQPLVCTLLQCIVTVEYSDEFLAAVTGGNGVVGSTVVELTAGHELEYEMTRSGDQLTYDVRRGYFAVNGNTMTVTFSGNIEGKTQKMTTTFNNITPRQHRKVKFVMKKNEQGNATFDIEISDLISDEELNNDLTAQETVIGDDPDAPKGDGGILLEFNYAAGCDEQLTDLENIMIVPISERAMCIKLKATVPGGIKKFAVDIESTGTSFNNALAEVNAYHIDLVNPDPAHGAIFMVVPFPHGEDQLLGKQEVEFDLSPAQEALMIHKGIHSFVMTILDMNGCKKQIPVTMIVE